MNIIQLILNRITEICLLMLIISIIIMNFCGIEAVEPLKTVVNLVVGAFFGAKIPGITNKE